MNLKISRKTKYLTNFILTLALTSTISSCFTESRQMYEEQSAKRIKSLDESTNKYCTDLGLNFSRENPIRSEMFFRCKIELAKRAKIQNPIKPNEMAFNQDLEKFIEIQDQQYMNSIENLNYYRNSILNNSHHKICQKKGYDFDSLQQDKIEEYLNCRESLIMTFELKPAYQSYQDLNYPQNSYNINFVINEKQDQEIKKAREFAKKYPFCSNLKIDSPKSIECKKAFDEKESCINNTKREYFFRKKRFQEICQQKLYIKLPESLLIEKKEKQTRAEKRNFNTDLHLNASYHQFLSNEKIRNSFMFKKNEEENKKQKDVEQKINNSFKQLYTKHELTSLRKKFINSCMAQVKPKVEKFVKAGLKTCNSITLKWDNKSR